ncbi:MAG: glycosyltransferase family 2 protein [bacterium]|nr:glycosyltransferase family 2 protein [bacterium]
MKGQEMTFSTVIPAFNAEKFISRALRSVLAQTRLPDEILVVDDGSSDKTTEIAESFGSAVRVIRQENGGASSARNRGIEEARCTYIALLDADDEWHPAHLSNAAAVFENHPEVLWYGAAYDWEIRSGVRLQTAPDTSNLVDGDYFEDYFQTLDSWCNSTPATVIHREVFTRVGSFDTELLIAEDLDLWFRIGLHFPRIGHRPGATVTVWEVEGSLMTQGLFTPDRAVAFIRSCAKRARALGPEAERRSLPFIVRWTVVIMRNALIERDVPALREISQSYGTAIPLRWRAISAIALLTPQPIWRLLMSVWAATRRTRLELIRRLGTQGASRSSN